MVTNLFFFCLWHSAQDMEKWKICLLQIATLMLQGATGCHKQIYLIDVSTTKRVDVPGCFIGTGWRTTSALQRWAYILQIGCNCARVVNPFSTMEQHTGQMIWPHFSGPSQKYHEDTPVSIAHRTQGSDIVSIVHGHIFFHSLPDQTSVSSCDDKRWI